MILTAFISLAFVKPSHSDKKEIHVVIDAGHGGDDSGAMIHGIKEKDIVEKITAKIKSLNKNKNLIIHLTRTDDRFVSLEERKNIINNIKPDLVISLHANSSKNKEMSGIEFFVSKDTKSYDESDKIAQKFHDTFLNKNFKVSEIKNQPYFLFKILEAPAIHIELGYLSNENDKKILTDDAKQNQIAETIISCISELK